MESQNLLDEFVEPLYFGKRRNLLPWWMKVFIWIFLLCAVLALVSVFYSIINNRNFSLSFYGMATNSPTSNTGIVLVFVFLYKGATAYALWSEDNTAIILGIIDAAIGIILCVLVMSLPFIYPNLHLRFRLRLELAFLIPYLIKLIKIKPEWDRRKKRVSTNSK